MTTTSRADEAMMAEINITPFTDVLLVLLIIFMLLAALVSPPGFEKSIPDSGPANIRTSPPPPAVEVAIDRNGAIFVDGERSDQRRVYGELARRGRGHRHLHVRLAAAKEAPYGAIMRVLDAASSAGLGDVDFLTS